MTLLNQIPDHDWFFCIPLSTGVLFITILGIIHPLCWLKVINAYRSELFLFVYVLIGFWTVLSCALLYAIFSQTSCLYMFWIWYTMVFGVAMVAVMFILIMGFWTLNKKRKAICAAIGFIYYLLTLYFVVVVNRQRKEVFGIQDGDCGEHSTIASTVATETPVTNTPAPEASTQPTKLVQPTSSDQPTTTTTTPTTTPTITPTNTPTTTPTTTPSMTKKPRRAGGGLRTPLMMPLLDADKQTTRAWVVDPVHRDLNPEEPNKTLRSVELDRVVRLAELLMNSDECRAPHKPAHGQYTVRRRRSTLRLKLRCDPGYRESSVATKCKHNWWDRPIPQCRKRRPPNPLPRPGGGCTMPVYPENGVYTVADHSGARPGDVVTGDNVILIVTCYEPYRPVDSNVVCVGGRWRHGPPTCLSPLIFPEHCKLGFDPTVDYKCLKAYKDRFLTCEAWQPDGTTVTAACRPGHAHRGPFRYMRCKGNTWDHVVSCVPNANFTR